MEDVTNYLVNVGKPREKKRFMLSVSYQELWAIVGLAQNPHEAMQDNPELMEAAQSIFYSGKPILDNVRRD